MIVTKYTADDLKKLPLRAIATFAARCARRVEHQALLPDDHPENEKRRTAMAAALCLAEDFARRRKEGKDMHFVGKGQGRKGHALRSSKEEFTRRKGHALRW
jgi:hypothetical protein